MYELNEFLRRLVVVAAAMAALCVSDFAAAQSRKVWVASYGVDTNPCSRSAPCATFSAASRAPQYPFEIGCVDSGEYGVVFIYGTTTIDCTGVVGRSVGVAIIGIGDVVLRGLSIECSGTANDGVFVGNSFASVNLLISNVAIKHCVNGVHAANGTASITIERSTVADNSQHGAYVEATMSATLAAVDTTFATNAATGVRIDAGSAMLTNVGLLGNGTHGATAFSSGGSVSLFLKGVTSSGNVKGGVLANGPGASVYLASTILTRNAWGMYPPLGGGVYISFGANQTVGNIIGDGSPTSTRTSF